MNIDRIGSVFMTHLERDFSPFVQTVPIPGGVSQAFVTAIDAPAITIEGYFKLTGTLNRIKQLQELTDNPDWEWSYLEYDANETQNDGFYVLGQISQPRKVWHKVNFSPFTLRARKIGDLGNLRISQYWTSTSEAYTGWSSLCAVRMVAVPCGASNIDATISGSRMTSDSVPFQYCYNPNKSTITWTAPTSPSSWYQGECRVWDTATVGDTTEANWVRVFSPRHKFAGDAVFENGLIRYKISGSMDSMFVWNTTLATNAWSSFGSFVVSKGPVAGFIDTASIAAITQFEITKLTPDKIRWREIRSLGNSVVCAHQMVLRRGAHHCRVSLTAYSGSMDATRAMYLSTSPTRNYDFYFNDSSSGTTASGNLPLGGSSYECGYASPNGWIGGFALLGQPTQQPYDTGTVGVTLMQSQAWSVNQTRVFFIMAFPVSTSAAFSLSGARAIAGSIAAECLYNVDQTGILVDRGYYV